MPEMYNNNARGFRGISPVWGLSGYSPPPLLYACIIPPPPLFTRLGLSQIAPSLSGPHPPPEKIPPLSYPSPGSASDPGAAASNLLPEPGGLASTPLALDFYQPPRTRGARPLPLFPSQGARPASTRLHPNSFYPGFKYYFF